MRTCHRVESAFGPIQIKEGNKPEKKGEIMDECLEGYVVQQELSSLEKPLFDVGSKKKGHYPKTVIISGSEQFFQFRRRDILERSKEFPLVGGKDIYYWGILSEKGVHPTDSIHYSPNKEDKNKMKGLEVPNEVASYYGLVEGDKIELCIDKANKIVYISSVNDCNDPKIFRSWPADLSQFQSDYPKEPLPLEKYGEFVLRVLTLLAPFGKGGAFWLIGGGGCGKTWILVKILEACLKLSSEDAGIYVLMGYVGDRPEDAAQYEDVFKRITNGRGQMHKAPWNTSPDTQVDVTKFVMKRAQRLTATGLHVIVCFDAISRTVAAHTASSYSDGEGGMISGGIRRQSLTDMIAMQFGTHGSFDGNRSLTIIGSVLSALDNKKTSEAVVDQETSDSSTTAMCRLLRIPTLERPWVSVNEGETYTRYPDGKDFRSEAQRKEMEKVKELMRGKLPGSRSSEDAHKTLLQYARDHPLPEY